MSDRSKKAEFTRVIVALLLALLLNANAHIFAHLGDAIQVRQTVRSNGDSSVSNTLSSFDKNHCIGCQSFRHLRLSAAVTFVQFVAHEKAAIGRRTPLFLTYNPASATSNRAPPLV